MPEGNDDSDLLSSIDNTKLVGGTLVLVLVGVVIAAVAFGGILDDVSMSDEPDFEFPNGASQDGIDATNITQSHNQAIIDNSYTVEFEAVTNRENETLESSRLYKHGVGSAYTVDKLVHGEKTEKYEDFGENEMYTKTIQPTEDGENVTYNYRQLEDVTPPYTGQTYIYERLNVLNFTFEGVEETGDTRVAVYTIDGIDNTTEVLDPERFDASGELRVSEDGYIKYFEFNMTDTEEDTASEQAFEITAFNSTEVEKPDWYDTAVEQTEPADTEESSDDTSEESGSDDSSSDE